MKNIIMVVLIALITLSSNTPAQPYDPYSGPDKAMVSTVQMSALSSAVEQQGPISVSIRSLNSQSFPFVFLDVDASDSTDTCTEFNESHINVIEDGVLQEEFFSVTPPNQNQGVRLVDVVFIMDNSGSMSGEQNDVRNNVFGFVDQLSQAGIDYAFGLTRYGQSAGGGAPIFEDNGILTSDPTYFKDDVWIRNVLDGGTEPGYRSIVESASNFNFRPGSRRVFIIITDENPDQGGATLEQVATALQDGDVTLFAVTPTTFFSSYQSLVDDPSQQLLSINANFDQIFSVVTNLIADTYRVSYKATDETINGLERTVEVQVACGQYSETDTTTYIPGSEPRITRTQETINLSGTGQTQKEKLTISAEVIDNVEPYVLSDRVKLYYRTTTPDNRLVFKPIVMKLVTENTYSVDIPADDVLEPGIDYYITASDGISTTTDPKVNPAEQPYKIPVLPNDAPYLSNDVIQETHEGHAIIVCAEAQDTTDRVESVVLYYRKRGELAYNPVPLQSTGGSQCGKITSANGYKAEIPKEQVTLNGVEYYLEAIDNHNTSTSIGTADQPEYIHVYPEITLGLKTAWGQSGDSDQYYLWVNKKNPPCTQDAFDYDDQAKDIARRAGCVGVAVAQLINYYLRQDDYVDYWLDTMLKDIEVYPRPWSKGLGFIEACTHQGYDTLNGYPTEIHSRNDNKASDVVNFLWHVGIGLDLTYKDKVTGSQVYPLEDLKFFKTTRDRTIKLGSLLNDRFRFKVNNVSNTLPNLNNAMPIIKNSIDDGKPVLLTLTNSSLTKRIGHAALIYGYRNKLDSGPNDYEFLINMGWANIKETNTWYSGSGLFTTANGHTFDRFTVLSVEPVK